MDFGKPQAILNELLKVDIRRNAAKFSFIPDYNYNFSREFIAESIQVLEELSHNKSDQGDRFLIAISALLWTYGASQWSGIDNYLILYLSRRGFGPTATMLDPGFKENSKFTSGISLINQFAITVNQFKHEITIGKKRFLITHFQKQVWDSIDANRLTGISAPTSAGKSYIILLKIIDLLIAGAGNIIYIVPTLSLVAQVSLDIRQKLNEFQLTCSVETNYNPLNYVADNIYVLTQERAIAAFGQEESPFANLSLLVVDEIQNVERVADSTDQRSKVLFDMMIDFREHVKIEKLIISGPRVTNIDELGKDIFGLEADKQSTKSSPVVNLTYAIKKVKKDYLFKLYIDLVEKPLILKIDNPSMIEGYGKSLYNKKYHSFLSSFISCFDPTESNIIFSPTTKQSRKTASELYEGLDNRNEDYLQTLSSYLGETVHEDFALSNTVLAGVAYHHGKLPHHVRNVVEDGIRKQYIKHIVCTTTLLQGVNLPVKNIVVRNPNLYLRAYDGEKPKLTNYETANLRGRAGRLLKDFIGRTFVMDEDSFVDNSQSSLFENVEKSITVGYRENFEQHEKKIMKDLNDGKGQIGLNSDYGYLLTYIRQTILRYGHLAALQLLKVGIKVDPDTIDKLSAELSVLEVPREICLANRYWDPIDLNKLHTISKELILPTSASERDIALKLKNLFIFFRDNFQSYYVKYFFINESEHFDHLFNHASLAEKWLREWPLSQILKGSFYDDDEKIEDVIGLLQNRISYGLPMLLKPLYDIRYPQSTFLRFIESGAYRPIVRRLIDMNIPRETAITLASNYNLGDPDNPRDVREKLEEIYSSLSYFDQVQLQFI